MLRLGKKIAIFAGLKIKEFWLATWWFYCIILACCALLGVAALIVWGIENSSVFSWIMIGICGVVAICALIGFTQDFLEDFLPWAKRFPSKVKSFITSNWREAELIVSRSERNK